jgi:hypothetical protein
VPRRSKAASASSSNFVRADRRTVHDRIAETIVVEPHAARVKRGHGPKVAGREETGQPR